MSLKENVKMMMGHKCGEGKKIEPYEARLAIAYKEIMSQKAR